METRNDDWRLDDGCDGGYARPNATRSLEELRRNGNIVGHIAL